jgi:hypothetical protein
MQVLGEVSAIFWLCKFTEMKKSMTFITSCTNNYYCIFVAGLIPHASICQATSELEKIDFVSKTSFSFFIVCQPTVSPT